MRTVYFESNVARERAILYVTEEPTQREINNWTNIDALLDQDDIILGRQYG